jgi:hypothetical protein
MNCPASFKTAPSLTSIAIAEILHDMNGQTVTAAQIASMAPHMTNGMILVGLDGALGLMTPLQVKNAVVDIVLNGPTGSSLDAPAHIPTYAEDCAAAQLVGIPGAFHHMIYGF